MSDSVSAIDVIYQTEISNENKSTEQLAVEANVQYKQAESLAAMSLTVLADVGRKIAEIKGRIPHGGFEDWCKENLVFSKRQAEQYMKLASKIDDENSLFSKTQTFADIGISRVWALLAAPEEVAAEVIETHDVTDMTVRELKEEIARIKEEKENAERKANILEHNNDDIRKELASMQRKLTESVSEDEFAEMQEALREQKKDLTAQINTLRDANTTVTEKLEKAKEDLKKQKAKQKELEAAKDEEIQKRLEEASAELVNKAKEEAFAEAEAEIKKNIADIETLEEKVRELEAAKAKLSNTSLMEFRTQVDMLQDIYFRINEIITEEKLHDPETGAKMQGALQKIVETWRP